MSTGTTSKPLTLAALVTHEVESFDEWKQAFDRHAEARAAAGIVGTHVNRHADDPNRLTVYLAATDASALQAFLSSDELAAAMRGAGVKGPPEVTILKPVEGRPVRDRPLAGAIVRHQVDNYTEWKAVFDGSAGRREAAGILGYAINRSIDDARVTIVYLQAETLDALKGLLGSSEVRDRMSFAGVSGPPEITYVQGVEWGT